MYKTTYVVKGYKLRYKKDGVQEIFESSKDIIKEEKQAYKRAWLLSEDAKFVTVDEIVSKKSRVLTIGKYEK